MSSASEPSEATAAAAEPIAQEPVSAPNEDELPLATLNFRWRGNTYYMCNGELMCLTRNVLDIKPRDEPTKFFRKNSVRARVVTKNGHAYKVYLLNYEKLLYVIDFRRGWKHHYYIKDDYIHIQALTLNLQRHKEGKTIWIGPL
jgi:hypothetical protein